MANEVCFLVDGFNVYHSVSHAGRTRSAPTRWLDLRSLCSSYLYLIGGGATLRAIYYFTAVAHHREATAPGTVRRHEDYIAALESTGVVAERAQFKHKTIRCPHCAQTIDRHEEKETDVAIAVKLLELVVKAACDTVVIMSGDTDLLPAIRAARRLDASRRICMLFPWKRFNASFETVADRCFKIKLGQYEKFQLPDPVVLSDGRTVAKPRNW